MFKRLIVLVFVLLVILGIGFLWWKDAISPVNPQDNAVVIFNIPKGQSVREIANSLKKEGLIKDSVAFFIYIRSTGLDQKIQAGNFQLNKSMDTVEVANSLTHGISDERVVILEGWRNEEIALELSKNLGIPESEFLKYAQEGYMFPDTYSIPKNATASQAAQVMTDNFQKKVSNKLLEKGKSTGLNFDQIIILASIIEREVPQDSDRAIVAGILLKRLREGWPLQADATIQYALGYQSIEKSWWKKDLTFEDLEINSLYNSYKNTGLPPFPIANPGLSAIESVVNPKETEYWFYLSDKKGFIHYSKTIEEHEEKVNTYLR